MGIIADHFRSRYDVGKATREIDVSQYVRTVGGKQQRVSSYHRRGLKDVLTSASDDDLARAYRNATKAGDAPAAEAIRGEQKRRETAPGGKKAPKERERVPPEIDQPGPKLVHERSQLDDAVLGKGVEDTVEKHTTVDDQGIRRYTPERTALHKRIIADLLAGHEEGREHPEILYTAGGPASGKSSVVDPKKGDPLVPSPEDNVHLDQDIVKHKLREYQQLAAAKDEFASDAVHREAADIFAAAEAEAMRRRMNLLVEGTGDSGTGQFADRIRAAHDAGYRTRVIYASAPTDEAIGRAKKRAEKEGRAVPVAGLRAMHANVSRVFPEIQQLIAEGILDELTVWDTRGPRGTPPKQILHFTGKELTVDDRELLKEFLAKVKEDDGVLIQLPTFV